MLKESTCFKSEEILVKITWGEKSSIPVDVGREAQGGEGTRSHEFEFGDGEVG